MREIKFRLWNGVPENRDAEKYFFENSIVMECLKQQMDFNTNGEGLKGYNHIGDGSFFEQFTGLTDKNGKEIYEGDIILSGNGTKQIIRFDEWDYQTMDGSINGIGFSFSSLCPFGKDVDGGGTCYEVLGNIHENQELLS